MALGQGQEMTLTLNTHMTQMPRKKLSFPLPIEAPHECTARLVSDLVENIEDRFSHIAAHMSTDHIKLYK